LEKTESSIDSNLKLLVVLLMIIIEYRIKIIDIKLLKCIRCRYNKFDENIFYYDDDNDKLKEIICTSQIKFIYFPKYDLKIKNDNNLNQELLKFKKKYPKDVKLN